MYFFLTHTIIVLTSTWKFAIYRLRLWFFFLKQVRIEGIALLLGIWVVTIFFVKSV